VAAAAAASDPSPGGDPGVLAGPGGGVAVSRDPDSGGAVSPASSSSSSAAGSGGGVPGAVSRLLRWASSAEVALLDGAPVSDAASLGECGAPGPTLGGVGALLAGRAAGSALAGPTTGPGAGGLARLVGSDAASVVASAAWAGPLAARPGRMTSSAAGLASAVELARTGSRAAHASALRLGAADRTGAAGGDTPGERGGGGDDGGGNSSGGGGGWPDGGVGPSPARLASVLESLAWSDAESPGRVPPSWLSPPLLPRRAGSPPVGARSLVRLAWLSLGRGDVGTAAEAARRLARTGAAGLGAGPGAAGGPLPWLGALAELTAAVAGAAEAVSRSGAAGAAVEMESARRSAHRFADAVSSSSSSGPGSGGDWGDGPWEGRAGAWSDASSLGREGAMALLAEAAAASHGCGVTVVVKALLSARARLGARAGG